MKSRSSKRSPGNGEIQASPGKDSGSPDSIVGLGVARYVVRLEPLARQSVEDVAELVAPVFQRYMVGRH